MQTSVSIQAFATRDPPVFETKEAERQHVRERLAAACRILGRRGLSEGLLGRPAAGRSGGHADAVRAGGRPLAGDDAGLVAFRMALVSDLWDDIAASDPDLKD